MTMRVFKCPYCGYRFRADPESYYARGRTDVVRGERRQPHAHRGRKRTVDLTCPQCEQEFEVEVEV